MLKLLTIGASVSVVLVVLPPFNWMVSAPVALLKVLPLYETVVTSEELPETPLSLTVSWNCSTPAALSEFVPCSRTVYVFVPDTAEETSVPGRRHLRQGVSVDVVSRDLPGGLVDLNALGLGLRPTRFCSGTQLYVTGGVACGERPGCPHCRRCP